MLQVCNRAQPFPFPAQRVFNRLLFGFFFAVQPILIELDQIVVSLFVDLNLLVGKVLLGILHSLAMGFFGIAQPLVGVLNRGKFPVTNGLQGLGKLLSGGFPFGALFFILFTLNFALALQNLIHCLDCFLCVVVKQSCNLTRSERSGASGGFR